MDAPSLRPLGVGDIIDRTIVLFRERWRQFALIAALPQLVFSIVSRLAGFSDPTGFEAILDAVQDPTAAPVIPAGAAETFGATALALAVLAIVVFAFQAGAIVAFAARRHLGSDMTVGDALRAALRALFTLIVAALVAFLALLAAVAAVTFALSLAVSVVAVALGPVLAVLGAFLVLVSVLFVAGFLLASWLVMPAVVMLEGAGPIAALRRSWQLARGARWRIVALATLVLVLYVVLLGLFSVIFLATFLADSVVRTVLQEAANLAAVAITTSLQWGAYTVLYYDLRVRREAYDLQLAAEQLPRDL